MKKIFSILTAGLLGLMAVSCVQEPLATFDPTSATAPVLGTTEVGAKAVEVGYTPAVFTLGFNEKIAPSHALAIVSVDGKAVSKVVSSKDDGSTLSATLVNISKALAFFGYADGDVVSSLELAVRATLQNLSQDNGVNGFIDSESRLTLNNFTVTIPVGSPYADYTFESDWSVIGHLDAYGIDWNGDLEMFATEDGQHLVAKAVKLVKGDEFKFRQGLDWAVNMGGAFGSLDSAFAVEQDGSNIVVGADGTFDLWLDLDANTATVTDAYLAYPDHRDASNWSVIGHLDEYGIDWNGDIPMLTDGSTHVAQGVKLKATDEFKFRQDKDWAVNMGGTFGSLGSAFAVEQDGSNIVVGADGIYDLILDPSGSATIVETLGGGVSGVIGGDEPEPEPAYTGWGIIGDFNEWGGDVAMTEQDGVWTGFFTNITKDDGSDGGFKLRKDADWAESAGGTFSALGEAFDAVTKDGPNIVVPAGFYKVVYDTNNQKITVSEGNVWSLIGDFNGWGGDVDMTETESGIWVSPATTLNNKGFKIRKNHDWGTSYGGEFKAIGEAFAATQTENNNIMLAEDGEYVVTFDANKLTITVDAAKPSKVWSVIGVVNGSNWDTDFYMTQVAPGIWVSEKLEIGGEWKVRFDNGWDVNRGAAVKEGAGSLSENGQFVGVYPGGENLTLTGNFQVVYNEMNQTVGTLGWGVVGKIASIPGFEWNYDIPMNLAADGKWYSVPVALDEGDEIKVRLQGGWDKNFGAEGKDATAADTAIAAKEGGENLKPAAKGTYMVVYDPTAGTLTLSTDFWGVIGDFNEWKTDRFMLPAGDGKWFAYNQEISGGWKIRKGADWAVSAGGNYTAGEAFEAVTKDGPNIAVTDMTRFDVLYDTAAGKITVTKPVK